MTDNRYGKYRATVRNIDDPDGLGRIQVDSAELPKDSPVWLEPCLPFAGDQVGLLLVPPVGAQVWIEFEAGDLSRPIWTGCFWDPSHPTQPSHPPSVVRPAEAPPAVLAIHGYQLVFREQDGGLQIDVHQGDAESKVSIRLEGSRLQLTADRTSIDMSDVVAINGDNLEVSV